MSDVFLQLSAEDRIEALATAAAESGRPAHLLEKDVWVVWALRALFDAPLGEALVFKGGTSLSKAYDVIQRFSEDIDLTYDIRRLLPDLDGASSGVFMARVPARPYRRPDPARRRRRSHPLRREAAAGLRRRRPGR